MRVRCDPPCESSLDGGGAGPKSLLDASTVQLPEKFGLSAAAIKPAVAAIANTNVVILFITCSSMFSNVLQKLLFVENVLQIELPLWNDDVIHDREHLAAIGKSPGFLRFDLDALSLADALHDQVVALPLAVPLASPLGSLLTHSLPSVVYFSCVFVSPAAPF